MFYQVSDKSVNDEDDCNLLTGEQSAYVWSQNKVEDGIFLNMTTGELMDSCNVECLTGVQTDNLFYL